MLWVMEQFGMPRKFCFRMSAALLSISTVLYIGCTAKKTTDPAGPVDADQRVKLHDTVSVKHESALNVLDIFGVLPDEMDGCTCSYAFSKKDLLEGEFFFVSDIDTTHIVSVQKHLTRLSLLRHKENLEEYGVDSLLVTFKTLATEDCKEEGCESWSFHGKVTIELGKLKPITKKYFAQCGC